MRNVESSSWQGLVNVPIEHHPTIRDIISNRYLKVMFKIPKKGHLPTPGWRNIFPEKHLHSFISKTIPPEQLANDAQTFAKHTNLILVSYGALHGFTNNP